MKGLPLLVLANKTDLGDLAEHLSSPTNGGPAATTHGGRVALTAENVRTLLDLDTLKQSWRLDVKLVECSGESGRGVELGFQWLTDAVAW